MFSYERYPIRQRYAFILPRTEHAIKIFNEMKSHFIERCCCMLDSNKRDSLFFTLFSRFCFWYGKKMFKKKKIRKIEQRKKEEMKMRRHSSFLIYHSYWNGIWNRYKKAQSKVSTCRQGKKNIIWERSKKWTRWTWKRRSCFPCFCKNIFCCSYCWLVAKLIEMK
jgi:hypothetical protein